MKCAVVMLAGAVLAAPATAAGQESIGEFRVHLRGWPSLLVSAQ